MLEPLLYPKTIAVVGASRSPGKVGYEILANLKKGGFAGQIIPVNPTAEEILGIRCYPSLAAYRGALDLSVIAVANNLVKAAVDDSIEAGAKAVIVITAGFKEVGPEGAHLEQEILEACRSRGVRLVGPNCLGVINAHHKMNASFAARMPKPGSISVISQSGALCTAMLDAAAGRRLGLSKLISMGNKADLTENEFLMALAEDPETKVVLGYLENIVSGNAFVKAAETAAAKKPIVIYKAGTTKAGVKAAASHTGGLAGADIAYGAAFRRAGIVRAESFEAMFDYATAFAMQPLPKGRRVAIITNAGGPGIMAADAVEQAGMEVGALEGGTMAALKNKLPSAASVGNPIDVLGDADPERYALAFGAAQDDRSVDAILVILTPQAMTKPAETARAIAAKLNGDKPVLVSFMGGEDVMPGRDELIASSLPDYPSPERAVAALKAMVEYAEWLHRPPRIITRFPVNRQRVARIINRHMRMSQRQVGEPHAKAILSAYGLIIPPGHIAVNADDAVERAKEIGFPVAMKIYSPDIIHKTDVGGIKLDLTSAESVRDAFDLMMLRVGQKMPQARLEGVYIEKMCKRSREVILGMIRDPQFGPMLMFGLGGIFVEVMKDVSFHLAPITELEAKRMLESTRSFALLKGVRGQISADLSAIALALQRISQLVTDFPEIQEMDINPFLVGEIGSPSIAADARITLGPRAEHS